MGFKEIIISIICIFISFMIFYSFQVIKTSEVGIRSTTGVIHEKLLKEGIHFMVPIFQNIQVFSLRQKQETFEVSHTQTTDMQPVMVKYRVLYAIPENKVLENLKTIRGDIFEVLIAPRANESIRDALAKYSAEELITSRDEISTYVKHKLAERVNNQAIIDDISIIEFDFENEEWKNAVQQKVIAKQHAEAAEIKKQQSQAEADQKVIIATAEAEAIKIRGNALTNNPKIVDLTIAEKWDGKTPQTVITNGNSSILLPINK